MDTTLLQLNHIQQQYAGHQVLNRLSLRLFKGEIGCLLGPSGCGKTTALRCIAGFEPVTDGEILINGECVSSVHTCVPPEKRQIGMVFQDYALFPHLDVSANIGFGLHRLPRTERKQQIEHWLQIVQLENAAGKYPHELSGGQQQRVALARALAPRPELLLLDEPFSNLDVTLREHLSLEVREILKKQGITAILVTHDQSEAFAIADKIGVMFGGDIQQWDSAYNLYHHPVNRPVADFIGQGVFLPGNVVDMQQIEIELGLLKGDVPRNCLPGSRIDVLIRPDDIVYLEDSPQRAAVINKAFRGAEILYTLRLASGSKVLSLVPSHHNHNVGEVIGIKLATEHIVAFKPVD
ncbi:iron(III) transport system ATP-binding protein [Nitrosomonas marina]|uniref:Iron(III) transport system ATP-binding protein n=1 Tax=Nitrosomonas marina TaxID=917 RepID=A0A1I0FMA0_9PROT|nr:ABC transporter ATP-binding protein [Nitrosomonas marina]SET59509.1 iron(III) transport system ATP-binding protein [Nitrosomonas marina]